MSNGAKPPVSAQATNSSNQDAAKIDGPNARTFPVLVKSLTGKVTTVQVELEDTILQLKERYQLKEGIPPDQQRLVFNAKQLEDTDTIEDSGITEGSTIFLLLRLRKPVIYVYATVPTDVEISLKLDPSWTFSVTYPVVHCKHSDENGRELCWNVVANPTGILLDKASRLEVSYLYWEAESTPSPNQVSTPPNSRPVSPTMADSLTSKPAISLDVTPPNSVLLPVAKIPQYLDKTLLALGLHTEARTAFITFWLPDLVKYSHIALRFLPQVEYDTLAHLSVSPPPFSISRVFMLWKGVPDLLVENWQDARESMANMEVSKWRDIVGLSNDRKEVSGLQVLEWGGMEVM